MRLRHRSSAVAAALVALGLAGCGGSSTSADSSSVSASPTVDCAELVSAMGTHIMAISLILDSGGSDIPVGAAEAQEFQVTVDRVAAAMPPLPADAASYLDMSQELADMLNSAAAEGGTFDEVLPDFEALINDPAYQAASEAGEAFVAPLCPTPSGAAS